ncbi:hypothetical protein BGZ65_009413, partial [Modicella reniformis]
MNNKARFSLEIIKGMWDQDIHIAEVHNAVVYEVRDTKNWNNAFTILKDYLAPFADAVQRAAENPSHAPKKRISLWDARRRPLTMRPIEDDFRLMRWSIGSLVRYAPSISESRTVFMFFLKLNPPLRDDETINHCLASLIFRYNAERNTDIRRLGVDLVRIALERGMGTLEYDIATHNNRPRNGRETFLARVSHYVLRSKGFQISDDGLSLERHAFLFKGYRMTCIAFRRRFLILLVPVTNFIFLAFFIFSPSSLPRLLRTSSTVTKKVLETSFDHINFHRKKDTLPLHSHVVSNSDSDENGNEPSGPGQGPSLDTNNTGIYYLLKQRRLVEGIQLVMLPDRLITTYRPGYLDSFPDLIQAQQQQQQQPLNLEQAQDWNIDLDPSTKYLTFLPHSGFHNQRTELENALLLARLLNRTLIIPKVYLGPPMPWMTFRRLHERLLYQTKTGLEHCRAIIENQKEETITYEDKNEHQQDTSTMAPNVFRPSSPSAPPEPRADRALDDQEHEPILQQRSEQPWPQQGVPLLSQQQRRHRHRYQGKAWHKQ